jgi:hypothetical protein
MFDPKGHLIAVIDAYAAATGERDTTISYRVFTDSKKVAALRGSASITTARYIVSMQWLSDHWPDGAVWPLSVDRPELTASEAA